MRYVKVLMPFLMILILSGCFDEKEKQVKFYGNVDVRTVSLPFRVSGRLAVVNFDEGQKVKKGDIIAKLDDSIYVQNLKEIDAQIDMQKANIEKLENGYRKEDIAKAKAKLLQIKVHMDNLKKEYDRVSNLHKQKSVSEQNFDNARSAYQQAHAEYLYAESSLEMLQSGYRKEDILSAKASLDALNAKRNLAKINLDDTSLISPTNGTVITRIYEAGSIVGPSQAVVEIAKDDEYWVRSYMSEKFLGILKTGLKAEVHTDNGKVYEGRVSFISPIAEFTPKTVQTEDLRTDLVYRFRIVLDKFDDSIKQGMPVTITFPNVSFNG